MSQTLVAMSPPDVPPNGGPAKKAPGRGVKIAAAIIAGIVVLSCIGAVTAVLSSAGGESTHSPPDRRLEARSMCETFVKQRLKAPATARFSGESATAVSSNEYIVGGSVDAQNGFGALLRSTFVCDLTIDAAKNDWTAKAVSVTPV
jgi:hypothetical protein